MEWIKTLKAAIGYMEDHLSEVKSPEEVARAAHISPMYLQKGFQVLTGMTLGEYIRNRRLFLAAWELSHEDVKIVDVALKYGYETQESFTKAFSRFHNATPSEIRKNPKLIRNFPPLRVTIVIEGGSKMDYRIENEGSMRFIGFKKYFNQETAQIEIPKYWDEIFGNCKKGKFSAQLQSSMMANHIGDYALCMDDETENGSFPYLIGGKYEGGFVPEELSVVEVPASAWAKFRAVGPLPMALQSVTNQIWNEWLPGTPQYELAGGTTLEWYSEADPTNQDYVSEVWVMVREKSK